MQKISLFIIVLFISPAFAKVYKCIEEGQTKFQETPCPKNSRGGEIEVKPNIVSTQGLRNYIEQDRIPKKLRDQKAKNSRRAKRAWMYGQVDNYSKQQKKRLRQKTLELKQREKKKTEIELAPPKVYRTDRKPL